MPNMENRQVANLLRAQDGLNLEQVLKDAKDAGYARVEFLCHAAALGGELMQLIECAKMLGYKEVSVCPSGSDGTGIAARFLP